MHFLGADFAKGKENRKKLDRFLWFVKIKHRN